VAVRVCVGFASVYGVRVGASGWVVWVCSWVGLWCICVYPPKEPYSVRMIECRCMCALVRLCLCVCVCACVCMCVWEYMCAGGGNIDVYMYT